MRFESSSVPGASWGASLSSAARAEDRVAVVMARIAEMAENRGENALCVKRSLEHTADELRQNDI